MSNLRISRSLYSTGNVNKIRSLTEGETLSLIKKTDMSVHITRQKKRVNSNKQAASSQAAPQNLSDSTSGQPSSIYLSFLFDPIWLRLSVANRTMTFPLTD